jgi:hypothetical protein
MIRLGIALEGSCFTYLAFEAQVEREDMQSVFDGVGVPDN